MIFTLFTLLLASTTHAVTLDEAKAALAENATCCSVLDGFLPGKVFIPGSSSYNASIERYWSNRANEIVPECTILAGDTEDVSTAVTILNAGYNTSVPNCQFAIRSGGHTPWKGANNIQGQVTIDLGNLTTLEVSADRSEVAVGSGLRWKEVYTPLQAMNLTVFGGRSPSVGVGGLLLNGGLSYFASEYGFGCENINNMEVVLASGEVVNANLNENTDLFKALKGGSNNFGVVTRFDLQAIELTLGWGGTVVSSFDTLFQQFDAIEYFTANTDIYSQLDFIYGWYNGSEAISPFLTYTKPVEEVPDCFKNFTSVPLIADRLRTAPLTDLVQDMYSPDGRRQSWSARSFFNNAEMYRHFHNIVNATVHPLIAEVPNISFYVSLQPLPQVLTNNTNGGNFLGIKPEDGDLITVQTIVRWDEEADDEVVLGAVKSIDMQAEAKARELGVFHGYKFQNVAESWQNPYPGRGADNLAALKEISLKYDPEQLFQKAVPGGWKL